MSNLKMYIAVHTDVPDHMVPVVVAHAVLGADDVFFDTELLDNYADWKDFSFKKVVLRVNEKEFQKIIDIPVIYKGHESSVMQGEPCCIVVCPREEYPNVIKFAKAWSPRQIRTSAIIEVKE